MRSRGGLGACSADECHGDHTDCPYLNDLMCIRNICGDAIAYIRQLEREKEIMIDWNRRANMIAVEDVKRRLTTCLELNMPADVQHETLRHALKVIEGLEQRVPRWISVEERLPEWDEPVLILVKETEHYGLHKEHSTVYYCQYLAYWDGDEWYTAWCNGCRKISDTANEPNADDYEVTHWMPLPQPPEEDEQ